MAEEMKSSIIRDIGNSHLEMLVIAAMFSDRRRMKTGSHRSAQMKHSCGNICVSSVLQTLVFFAARADSEDQTADFADGADGHKHHPRISA